MERHVFPTAHHAAIEPSETARESVAKFFNFKFGYFRIRALIDYNTPEGVHVSKWSEVEQMRACIAEGYLSSSASPFTTTPTLAVIPDGWILTAL